MRTSYVCRHLARWKIYIVLEVKENTRLVAFINFISEQTVVKVIKKHWHFAIVFHRMMMNLRDSVSRLSSSTWTLHSHCRLCVASLKPSWISRCMIMSFGCKTVSRFDYVSWTYFHLLVYVTDYPNALSDNCQFGLITSPTEGDRGLCFCQHRKIYIYTGIYVCEQLPGANSSPTVTKLHQSYRWPQGTRWLNFGRSRSVGVVCALLNALLVYVSVLWYVTCARRV